MQSLETNITIEQRTIPAWARAAGLSRCFLYRGISMMPTFHPGFLLYVRPRVHDIIQGDVIVFSKPSGYIFTVHRVVSTSDKGFVTRGDNNRRNDAPVVAQEQVVGRVEFLDDKGKPKPVYGGKRGLWSARLRWGVLLIDGYLRRILHAPYMALRDSSITRRILGRCFLRQVKLVRMETQAGTLIKTTFNGRTVARWWPQLKRFDCHKPYDLFISRPDDS